MKVNKKKITSVLLSTLMAVQFLPVCAFTTEAVLTEYGTEYGSTDVNTEAFDFINTTVQTVPLGDVTEDGNISVSDMIALKKYLLAQASLDAVQAKSADLNLDGKVNVFDMILMQKAVVYETSYPTYTCTLYNTNIGLENTINLVYYHNITVTSVDELEWFMEMAYFSTSMQESDWAQYDADFFAENVLSIAVLPAFEETPFYQVESISADNDTVCISIGDIDAMDFVDEMTLSHLDTAFMTVALPKEIVGEKTISFAYNGQQAVELLTHWTYYNTAFTDYDCTSDSYTYTSPDDAYTLYVSQLQYFWKPSENTASFKWLEEGENIALDSVKTVNTAPFSDDYTIEDTLYTGDAFSLEWEETGVTVTYQTGKTSEQIFFAYPDRTISRQSVDFEIDDSKKPEVTNVQVTADCWGNIAKKVNIRDMYNIDIMSSGVVGLVGAPVEYTTSGTVTNAELTMTYNPDELRGIPEENLIVLYYQNSSYYKEIDFVCDTENHTVTFQAEQEGVYLLADIYQWYGAWGIDNSAYAYEVDVTSPDYVSDWQRECETGSILELADREWAVANAPNFKVSTPEQLASAIYYANAISDRYIHVNITLENDIDLSGYTWMPIGWNTNFSHMFCGTIDGQGYAIQNMNLTGNAFIAISDGCRVKNITFENASVNTDGRYAGIVCGETSGFTVFENVHATGSITCSSYAKYGALVGDGDSTTFKDCTADVTVNGEAVTYFSDYLRAIAEINVENPITITLNEDYTITREASDYDNLTWTIYRDDTLILERNADNETTVDLHSLGVVGAVSGATYKVYVSAWVDGYYVPISNTLEYIYP